MSVVMSVIMSVIMSVEMVTRMTIQMVSRTDGFVQVPVLAGRHPTAVTLPVDAGSAAGEEDHSLQVAELRAHVAQLKQQALITAERTAMHSEMMARRIEALEEDGACCACACACCCARACASCHACFCCMLCLCLCCLCACCSAYACACWWIGKSQLMIMRQVICCAPAARRYRPAKTSLLQQTAK